MRSLGVGEHEIDCRPRPRFIRGDRGASERAWSALRMTQRQRITNFCRQCQE